MPDFGFGTTVVVDPPVPPIVVADPPASPPVVVVPVPGPAGPPGTTALPAEIDLGGPTDTNGA